MRVVENKWPSVLFRETGSHATLPKIASSKQPFHLSEPRGGTSPLRLALGERICRKAGRAGGVSAMREPAILSDSSPKEESMRPRIEDEPQIGVTLSRPFARAVARDC